jgi:lipoprotein-anchoring transpeptidase ErfK/SrfK
MSRRAVAAALTIGLALVIAAAAIRVARDDRAADVGSSGRSLAAAARALPRPEGPAFVVGKPARLRADETRARSAPVVRPAVARAAPARSAAAVAPLPVETPEGTSNIVLVLGERTRSGTQWVHVRLPLLPNGRTAWVPRGALGGYRFVHTRLVVDRERLRATLFYDGRPIFHAPVGVGRPEWPTPSGRFYIRDKLAGFGDPFYGPVAFGTSARSAVLTDWPAGGFVGIHGTNEPQLIPGQISHGCIRLRNADILRLGRLMPVGTPLVIR